MDLQIHHLIQLGYETVVAPQKWPEVLQALAEALDAKGCIIFEVSKDGAAVSLHSESLKADLLAQYMTFFAPLEQEEQALFADLASPEDAIEVVTDRQLFTSPDDLSGRANVQALGHFGIGHRAFAMLDKDNRSRYRFSVQQSGRHGALTDQEAYLLQNVLPHFAKALQLGQPMVARTATHEGLVEAMALLDIGVCVVDSAGRKLFANAEHYRQCEDFGTFRTATDGTLLLNANGDSARLNALLTDISAHGRCGARPRREAITFQTSGKIGAICLEISPQPSGGAIIFSKDTTKPIQFDGDTVARVYGLTEAEQAVLGLLGRGLKNAEIADQRSRAVDTINAQVKTILSKTQCSNRTQLVRLLLNFRPHQNPLT